MNACDLKSHTTITILQHTVKHSKVLGSAKNGTSWHYCGLKSNVMNSLVHTEQLFPGLETSTHSLPFRLFFSSPSLREIEDDPCRPCICVIKLTSIKVILLNTNWNEYFITNFSSVCFNTVRLRNVIKAGYLRWLDTVFQGQYLPSLSINYVAINKVLEKLPPQLY